MIITILIMVLINTIIVIVLITMITLEQDPLSEREKMSWSLQVLVGR